MKVDETSPLIDFNPAISSGPEVNTKLQISFTAEIIGLETSSCNLSENDCIMARTALERDVLLINREGLRRSQISRGDMLKLL